MASPSGARDTLQIQGAGASRLGAGGMESERDTLGASSLLIMFVLFSLHWAIGTWVLVV